MGNNQKNISFLQSAEWRKFQSAVGRKVFSIENVSIIEHELPIVGKYFYIPHGPIIRITNHEVGIMNKMQELINLAQKNNAGWIRIDPANEEVLKNIKNSTDYKIQKAPHDMQPKEIFVIDILKSEEELLSEMKPKTRYNINLAFKRGVKIISSKETKYVKEFLRLVTATAKRKKVTFHSENYYRKMIEEIPENMLKLYVAEYENKIIAANLVIFFGDSAIYLHGATDDEYRNIMAPYLLQWQAILDAKNAGYKFYDFGGIKTVKQSDLTPALSLLRRGRKGEVGSWQGITKFKLGFSPNTKPTEFPGSYDIIINRNSYFLYSILQKIRSLV